LKEALILFSISLFCHLILEIYKLRAPKGTSTPAVAIQPPFFPKSTSQPVVQQSNVTAPAASEVIEDFPDESLSHEEGELLVLLYFPFYLGSSLGCSSVLPTFQLQEVIEAANLLL
jgi:hypothetical protein